MIATIDKPAYNEEYRTCEFRRPDGTGPLNSTETIASVVSVTCVERDAGTDRTATMIANAAIYNNTQVKYQIKGGTAGVTYTRIIRIISSNNQKIEDRMNVKVT